MPNTPTWNGKLTNHQALHKQAALKKGPHKTSTLPCTFCQTQKKYISLSIFLF